MKNNKQLKCQKSRGAYQIEALVRLFADYMTIKGPK